MALIPMGTAAPAVRIPQPADQIPWTADQTISRKTISQPFTIDNFWLATMDCDRTIFQVVEGDEAVPKVNTLYPPNGVSP